MRIGPVLPQDQQAQEVAVARLFAREVIARRGRSWTHLRSHDDDPPDVLGQEADFEFGLELGEIKSAEQTRGSVRLERFVGEVYVGLERLRPTLRGKVFQLTFEDALLPEQPLPSGKRSQRLVPAVVDAIEQAARESRRVALPAPLSAVVPRPGTPFENDPRVPHPDDPLLTTDARTTAIEVRAVEEMTTRIARVKLRRDTDSRTNYLLLWSLEAELFYTFPAIRESVRRALQGAPVIPYNEVFLFALPHLGRVLAAGFDIPSGRRR